MAELKYQQFSELAESSPAFQNVTPPAAWVIAFVTVALFKMPKPENRVNCGLFTTRDLKTYQVGAACPLHNGSDPLTPVELPELRGKHPQQLDVGTGHAVMLLNDGTAYTWGANEVGQLGHGDTTTSSRPKKVTGDATFSKIYVTAKATLGLAGNQDVYQWGQLNPRSNEKYSAPHNCGFKAGSLVPGAYHAGAMDKNKLYTWGLGADGRLGHGNEDDLTCDKAKKLEYNVDDAAFATRSTAIVDDSMNVRVFGRNYGNLKPKQGPKILTPTLVKKIGDDVDNVVGSWTDDIYVAENENDDQFIFGDLIAIDDPDADKEGTQSKGSPPRKSKNRVST